MEHIFCPANLHGVAGIVATLGAENPVRLSGHDVEDFSFPLIPPLEAKHNRNVRLQWFLTCRQVN